MLWSGCGVRRGAGSHSYQSTAQGSRPVSFSCRTPVATLSVPCARARVCVVWCVMMLVSFLELGKHLSFSLLRYEADEAPEEGATTCSASVWFAHICSRFSSSSQSELRCIKHDWCKRLNLMHLASSLNRRCSPAVVQESMASRATSHKRQSGLDCTHAACASTRDAQLYGK